MGASSPEDRIALTHVAWEVYAAGGRRPPSYVFAYVAMAATLVGAFLAVVIVGSVRAFTASDRFGTVPMPGRETLDLPAGDVTVYFQEDVDLGENENLRPPGDIRLDVRAADGSRVELDPGGFPNEVSGGFGTRVSIGDLDVPAGGDYVVAVAPTAEGRNTRRSCSATTSSTGSSARSRSAWWCSWRGSASPRSCSRSRTHGAGG